MASQDFVSSLVLTEAQVSSLVEIEPAFEHLLRDVGLEEETIRALRHCRTSIVRRSLDLLTLRRSFAVLPQT